MHVTLRSYAKINLGLAIGPVRPDRFHALATLYQTLAAHDLVRVELLPRSVSAPAISITSNDARVPLDERNTVWKMLARALARPDRAGVRVAVHIEKRLPVQGGMGAGSANAAAALIGLERLLARAGRVAPLGGAARLRMAAEVGSDVPLFLIGGAVFGSGRGELVAPAPDLGGADAGGADVCGADAGGVDGRAGCASPDLTSLNPTSSDPTSQGRDVGHPVEAISPGQDVGHAALSAATDQWSQGWESAPGWEAVVALPEFGVSTPEAFRAWDAGLADLGLTPAQIAGRLEELSCALASAMCERHASGVLTMRGRGLAGTLLSALVQTGKLQNDFEEVVFRQHPLFSAIKQALVGQPDRDGCVYAALSGSGSAVFGLFGSGESAVAAVERLNGLGVRSLRTRTMDREAYWAGMVADENVG